jgi:hypothetical protein
MNTHPYLLERLASEHRSERLATAERRRLTRRAQPSTSRPPTNRMRRRVRRRPVLGLTLRPSAR